MNRTPDEIKKGLEEELPVHYHIDGEPRLTPRQYMELQWLHKDTLALVQQLEAQNAELLKKIEQLQAERDAAVADVKSLCATNYFSGNYCAYCKHNEPDGQCHHPCAPYTKDWGWEWRGVQKEE